MLYRFTTFAIIAFWLVMMALLVRLETHPDETGILDVPVSYVERIMFKHCQQSFLTVLEGDKPIGTVSLRPSTSGSNARVLDFSGALSVQIPFMARQRFSFNGTVDMDAALKVLDFHLELNLQAPRCRLTVTGDAARNILTCEAREGNRLISSQTLPMNAAGLGLALSQYLGLNGNALPISPGAISPPAMTARETEITLHGEQLEVFQVTIREGTSPVADLYVTQLGQIILAKTTFGYTFAEEGYE